MADFANLVIGVNTAGLKKGERALDATTRAGMRTERATDRTTRSMSRLGVVSGGSAASGIIATTIALGGLTAAFFTLRAVGSASQIYAGIGNNLRAIGVDASDVAFNIQQIGEIAQRTRTPLEATAQLYQRVSIAGRDLGASQADVLRFTENVGLALAQQGGGAAQASGALLQLSQAMAGGTVRAEEFNSILEGAFPIAQAAANAIDGASGSVGQLRNMVIAGEVSSKEFFDAILSSSDALEDAFANTVPTVSQAMTVLGTTFTLFIGQLDTMVGASAGLSSSILFLAENLDSVLGIAIAAGAGVLAFYVPAIVAATTTTAAWIASLITLKGALIATGVGALVVIVGLLIGKLLEARRMAASFGDAFKVVGFQVKATVLNMKAWFISALGSMASQFVEFTWTVADGLNSLFGTDLMGADATITQDMNRAFLETEAAAKAAEAAAAALRVELNSAPDGAPTTQATLADLDAANGAGGGSIDQQNNADLAERDRILDSLKTDQDKYNEALAQANRLLAANVLPSEAYAQHVAQLRQELTDAEWANSGLKPFIDDLSQAGLSMESLADVFQNAIARMAQSWLSSGLTSLGQSFMGIGASSPSLDIVNGFFGGARANGGPVSSGKSYLVGERGPEMFSPQSNGSIIPNNALGGSQAPVINIVVNGARGNAEIVEMVGIGVSAGIQQNNKRIATAQGRPT